MEVQKNTHEAAAGDEGGGLGTDSQGRRAMAEGDEEVQDGFGDTDAKQGNQDRLVVFL